MSWAASTGGSPADIPPASLVSPPAGSVANLLWRDATFRIPFLDEEEISDVSLATFHFVDKEDLGNSLPGTTRSRRLRGRLRLRTGCGGGFRGCGGFEAAAAAFGGCGGFRGCGVAFEAAAGCGGWLWRGCGFGGRLRRLRLGAGAGAAAAACHGEAAPSARRKRLAITLTRGRCECRDLTTFGPNESCLQRCPGDARVRACDSNRARSSEPIEKRWWASLITERWLENTSCARVRSRGKVRVLTS